MLKTLLVNSVFFVEAVKKGKNDTFFTYILIITHLFEFVNPFLIIPVTYCKVFWERLMKNGADTRENMCLYGGKPKLTLWSGWGGGTQPLAVVSNEL